MNCGEIARARGVFELAVTQSTLDMPELLWKHYIDLEISEGRVTFALCLHYLHL